MKGEKDLCMEFLMTPRVNVGGAACLLKVHRVRIYQLLKEGKLQQVPSGIGGVFISIRSILDFMDSRRPARNALPKVQAAKSPIK